MDGVRTRAAEYGRTLESAVAKVGPLSSNVSPPASSTGPWLPSAPAPKAPATPSAPATKIETDTMSVLIDQSDAASLASQDQLTTPQAQVASFTVPRKSTVTVFIDSSLGAGDESHLQPQSAARPHSTTAMGVESVTSPDAFAGVVNSVGGGSPKRRNAIENFGSAIPSPRLLLNQPSSSVDQTSRTKTSASASADEGAGGGGRGGGGEVKARGGGEKVSETVGANTPTAKVTVTSPQSGAPQYSTFRRRGCWRTKSSMYRGVSFNRKNQKWKAVLTVNCKQHFLGYFVKEIEAAKAYDREARA
jgi:hypothetical protein